MTVSDPDTLLASIVATLVGVGIPHMIVGSFASTAHGQPRTTHDLDLVIDPSPEQLESLLASLDPALFYVDPDVARDAPARRMMFNVIDLCSGWRLGFIIRKLRPFSVEEMQRRVTMTVLGTQVATATAEDTIVSKLEWAKLGSSQRQLEDVAGILRVRSHQLDVAYIEHWVRELGLEELWRTAQAMALPQ